MRGWQRVHDHKYALVKRLVNKGIVSMENDKGYTWYV